MKVHKNDKEIVLSLPLLVLKIWKKDQSTLKNKKKPDHVERGVTLTKDGILPPNPLFNV